MVEVKEMIIKTTNKKEEISKIEYQEKEKIDFIQYSSRINFNDCYDTMEMGTFISACDEMCKVIGDYIQDKLDHWKELTDLNITINRILKLDEQITEKEEKNIEDILKTEVGENIFIKCLSQLRTTGYYEKSKNFIEFIGRTLNIILDSEKNKLDYQIIKSCLILSQTFYYLDLNKEKRFIFEYILKSKVFNSPNFWRGFIDYILNSDDNKVNINKMKIKTTLLIIALLFLYQSASAVCPAGKVQSVQEIKLQIEKQLNPIMEYIFLSALIVIGEKSKADGIKDMTTAFLDVDSARLVPVTFITFPVYSHRYDFEMSCLGFSSQYGSFWSSASINFNFSFFGAFVLVSFLFPFFWKQHFQQRSPR